MSQFTAIVSVLLSVFLFISLPSQAGQSSLANLKVEKCFEGMRQSFEKFALERKDLGPKKIELYFQVTAGEHLYSRSSKYLQLSDPVIAQDIFCMMIGEVIMAPEDSATAIKDASTTKLEELRLELDAKLFPFE